MTHRTPVWSALVASIALLLAVTPSMAEEGSAPFNVAVSITMGDLDGGSRHPRKSFEVLTVDGGQPTSLLAGSRLPIPVTQFQASGTGGEAVPMTSFTYQNIGFTAQIEARVISRGTVEIRAEIEDSSVREQETPAPQPTIDTREYKFRAVLRDGVPLQVQSVSDPTLGSVYFEIEADILD